MEILRVAYKYLKKYPYLTGATLVMIAMASLFEGASLGMLIPLLQGMTNAVPNPLADIPLLGHLRILHFKEGASSVSIIFSIVFILIAVKNAFSYISNVLISKLRFAIIRDLNTGLMNKLIEYDLKYYDMTNSGHLISALTIETTRMGGFIMEALKFVAISGRILTYIALLFAISIKASIVIFLMVAGVLLPLEMIMLRLKKLGEDVSRAISDYNHKLTEIFSGIRVIKTFGTENIEKRDFASSIKKLTRLQYISNKYINLLIPLSETLIFFLIVALFLFLVNVVRIDIASTFPVMATYLLVLIRALTQLNTLNGSRSDAINNLASFKRYEAIYDDTGKMVIKSGVFKLKEFSDSIDFKDVSFAYLEGKPVLDKVNINIPRGKVTAIVGSSGVGKSTIVNLILRFYDPSSGVILVDGINLKDLSLPEWRKKIGFVSQDIFVFNKSARENICYGCVDVKNEKIIEAAKAAGAHDFIMSLPNGYDTVLGERGITLSGGQRQRISIARAIISDPDILILDEATSSLDTETERLIKGAIDRLTKNRTVVAITHRLSTIMEADNIIVLDKGVLVESGAHKDLVKKQGLYKHLYEMQTNMKDFSRKTIE
ncbi:MAG: ABC transporter ATP-binding protein/permease [Candidatus Omnitrophica bacterium]|nr:ABC transporter ATP-binding protein/permease [Candidatus Omnitrophota bacterium]MCM8790596.1 ABC transporter ATP-binding protein/permease [Candidatus Omnitrophota bacterium]